ncbi:MAG: adenine deaminase, partial [Bacteroidales bacterium]|nr:adenine deaminase [Bacteroidales bacterium]
DLPVAGLMSDKPVPEIAEKYQELSGIVKSLGCVMKAPFMTLSFMALLVIPQLKLSDKGLFSSKTFNYVPLFIS